jgi:nucleotide sugar dehydrogenase
VSGVDAASLERVDGFYSRLVETTVPVSGPREAEMCKLLENTFRHVNIALVNELAMFAGDLGVDIWEVIRAASSKPFGYMPFTPGPGVGGHCLPIDPSYLSWKVEQSLGTPFRFVELANDVNEHMPDYVASRIGAMLNTERRAVNGTRMLLLGMTYKAGTSDWRESPSRQVAQRLAGLGADLRLCDPHLPALADLGIDAPLVEFSPEELAAADLVVVLVDHPEFDPAVIAANSSLVFDSKAILRGHDFAGELL